MTNEQINQLIASDQLIKFYTGRAWKRLRSEVLAEDHYECQECKRRGRYTKATHVHHVNHLRDRPDLAMSKTYVDADGRTKRNLASVCKGCHETVCHPERLPYRGGVKPEPVTKERWDW